MSEYVGKKHVRATQNHWLTSKGRAALQQAFEAIPIGDTVRAERFCEFLQAAVRNDMTISEAQAALAEKWK